MKRGKTNLSDGCIEVQMLLQLLRSKYNISAHKFATLADIPPLKLTRWKRGYSKAPNEFILFCNLLISMDSDGIDIKKYLAKSSSMTKTVSLEDIKEDMLTKVEAERIIDKIQSDLESVKKYII